MKIAPGLFLPVIIALVLVGCRGETRITVLFTGDERGWIIPAG